MLTSSQNMAGAHLTHSSCDCLYNIYTRWATSKPTREKQGANGVPPFPEYLFVGMVDGRRETFFSGVATGMVSFSCKQP